ncbi:hypothetical protein FQN54_009102 [Arachnomyces sp. PD_36]|nr:hypothetical protein FQN54_009102 [Arachnomyces sp. PD_36]
MAEPTEFSRFQLPGFTLPLEFAPSERRYRNVWRENRWEQVEDPPTGEGNNLFPNALDMDQYRKSASTQVPLTTLREFTMLNLMNQLTDKPDWEVKVFNDSITEKWKMEAMNTEGADVTERMFDYVIQELRYKADDFKETGFIRVYEGDVVKSDQVIPESLQHQLKALVTRMEDVPDFKKDYHPGSNDLVLDLVHPSLFPLVYGRSRILPDSLVTLKNYMNKCGEGEVLEVPPSDASDALLERQRGTQPYSRSFQWLPCDVEFVAEEGVSKDADDQREEHPKCKITSYINNLHPHSHRELYECIEGIIGHVIPQWNRTLGPLEEGNIERNERIKYRDCVLDLGSDEGSPEPEEDETDSHFEERMDQWNDQKHSAPVVLPEPEEFQPPLEKTLDLQEEFGHRGLQIIVKLANIHLTPEKPEYEGGTWHVEGQMNEHICATALYYYDSENITESRLAFRQQVDSHAYDINYEQDQHQWMEQVFGCNKNGPLIQNVGEVVCRPGRVITFPNILQHQVQPFRLHDASRPGHRKILALFLVDPNIRVISTANVPPQQREWWGDHIRPVMSVLPAELQDSVIKAVDDFPIGIEEAKEIRLRLMEERKNFVVHHTKEFGRGHFSLCEH